LPTRRSETRRVRNGASEMNRVARLAPRRRAPYRATRPTIQSSGSSLMIERPWLLPTQKVTGVVVLSTNTRRMLVERGS
jgi:hypothetical protein